MLKCLENFNARKDTIPDLINVFLCRRGGKTAQNIVFSPHRAERNARCGGTPLVSSASSTKSSVDQSELFRATRLGIVQTLRVYKQRNVAGLTALSEMELTFTIVQFLLYPLHTNLHYKSCVTSARSSDGDPLEYCPSI